MGGIPFLSAGVNLLQGIGSRNNIKNATKAANAAIGEGVNYAKNESDLATTYAPGGKAAFNQQQNLLGLGADPAAAQQGFNVFRDSAGYRNELDASNDALNSSLAAGVGFKSGAADKARARMAGGVAGKYFDNYFSKLGDQADKGYGASNTITNAVIGGTRAQAENTYTGYTAANKATQDTFDNVLGDFGAGLSGLKLF